MKIRNEDQAKELAKRIGLTYWQALVSNHDVDPMVFVYAEAILRKTDGIRHDIVGQYSSWRNLTPDEVAAMWKAAGKRNSEKFRFQVLHRIVAKRGDTISFLRHCQSGKDWAERNSRRVLLLPRKTLAAIGRLTEEARYALLPSILNSNGIGRIRVRDLDWEVVKAIEYLRSEGSERSLLVRAALLPTQLARTILGLPPSTCGDHPITKDRVREFCPTYPNLSVEVAGRVAFGTSPVAISNNLLSRKEAHQWLLAGGPVALKEWSISDSVIEFLTQDLGLRGFVPRNVEVARWLVHVHTRGAWSALLKIHRFPDGRTFRYLNLLDEIIPEDLDRGISTGVERAFERSRQRFAQVNAEDHRTICSNPFRYLPKWISLLTTPAGLAMEGRIQDHCVGGYASQVEEGECLILSIVSSHGRSTVEVRRGDEGWWAAQHYSYRNGPPPSRHETLLEAWLQRENQALP